LAAGPGEVSGEGEGGRKVTAEEYGQIWAEQARDAWIAAASRDLKTPETLKVLAWRLRPKLTPKLLTKIATQARLERGFSLEDAIKAAESAAKAWDAL